MSYDIKRLAQDTAAQVIAVINDRHPGMLEYSPAEFRTEGSVNISGVIEAALRRVARASEKGE